MVLNQGRPRPRRPVPRKTDAPGLASRRAALDLLDAVLARGRMLEEGTAGDPALRAEARGLADLCLRRLGQIDDVLSRFLDRTPKGTVQQILRLMAAELLFAGTPPHAAVDLGVRLTQTVQGARRMSGLVNAVGRKVADQGPVIVDGQDPGQMNMPGKLRAWLTQDWGGEAATAMARAHLIPAPHDLTLKAGSDTAALATETAGTMVLPGTVRVPGRPQISALPGFAEGAWWVQDAAATLPATLLPATETVLDVCAAPGGKTLQLAARGNAVTALDISARRMERVAENLTRTGLDATMITADALDWTPDRAFGAILLDAPCSATGTIRRHPDLPYRLDKATIAKLTDLQARLIDRAFDWLAPGGTLVWCTCSLLKREGEHQAQAFLDRTPNAEPVPITADEVPASFISGGMLRTRPDQWAEHGGIDGFFAQRIRRRP